MWNEGTIGVPTGDGKYLAIHYWVKDDDFDVEAELQKPTFSKC